MFNTFLCYFILAEAEAGKTGRKTQQPGNTNRGVYLCQTTVEVDDETW